MIAIRIPKDIEEKIKRISKKLGTTKSGVIKKALEKFIKEQEKTLNEKSIDTLREAVNIYSQEQTDLDINEIYKERLKAGERKFSFN